MAIFALEGRADLAAQVMHDEMQSVADAQDGHAGFENGGVGDWRVTVVHARRAAGKHDADGFQCLDFGDGDRAGKYDGEDVELADAAGDELRVLRPEIEDDDRLGVHVSVWQGAGGDVKNRKGTTRGVDVPLFESVKDAIDSHGNLMAGEVQHRAAAMGPGW